MEFFQGICRTGVKDPGYRGQKSESADRPDRGSGRTAYIYTLGREFVPQLVSDFIQHI